MNDAELREVRRLCFQYIGRHDDYKESGDRQKVIVAAKELKDAISFSALDPVYDEAEEERLWRQG